MTDTTPDAAALSKTPLFAEHERLGARLVPFAGYSMPIQYAGIVKEHTAVRTRAGIFDVSHMGELRFRGPRAAEFVNGLVTNDLSRIAIGQAMYTCACNQRGGILDDLIIYKHADDDILVVCNASNRPKMVAHFSKHVASEDAVVFTDESDQTALLALQGPRAFDVLAKADGALRSLAAELRPFRFSRNEIDGAKVTLARTGYTGEDGVEIFCGVGDAAGLFRKLLDRGASEGVEAVGLGARDTLRLEARLSLYGNELSEQTNPLEAGLGWVVRLGKPGFLGKEALVEAQGKPAERVLVGLEMVGRGVARSGYPIHDERGDYTGTCTSGSPSPTLGKAIGLAYVSPKHQAVGTKLLVDCRGKIVEAVVTTTPFYRRPKS